MSDEADEMDAFRHANPFALWHAVPPALRSVVPNVSWDRVRMHALVSPAVAIEVDELRWQLNMPCWRSGPEEPHFSLSPNQVRQQPERFARHWQRTSDSDLRFPIHVLRRDQLIILDGMHRLLKAEVQAMQTIRAHIVELAVFREEVVELANSAAFRADADR
ncbi:MAG: hypothetical protein JWP01_427 [Myxococcales bacterium]|nr:hypothetical protein [Myxococcales bacterium]